MKPSAININLDRLQVIEKLKMAHTDHSFQFDEAMKQELEYQSKLQDYNQQVIAYLLSSYQSGNCELDYVEAYSSTVAIRFSANVNSIFTRPSKPNLEHSADWHRRHMNELDRMIKLLEMSPDATIKSKQYNDLINYIL